MTHPHAKPLALLGAAALLGAVALTSGRPRTTLTVRPPRQAPAVVARSPELTTTTTTTELPPAPQPPAAEPPPVSYTVAPGDTLAAVAAAHGLDWPGLCAANRLDDCSLIYPGQTLTLRSSSPPSQPPATATPVPTRTPPAPPNQSATTPPVPASSPGFGCAAALAYLAAHQAPGFTDICAPHSAYGRYGMTCFNHPPQCAAGSKVIYIACPAPFVYQNEAQNSIVLSGGPGRIDAWGQGTPTQDATCNRYR